MEVKPLFSLLAAKAAIVNQLHGLSVCFASFNMVTPTRKWGRIIVSQLALVMESLMLFVANMSAANTSPIILERIISFVQSLCFYLTSPLQRHADVWHLPSN